MLSCEIWGPQILEELPNDRAGEEVDSMPVVTADSEVFTGQWQKLVPPLVATYCIYIR